MKGLRQKSTNKIEGKQEDVHETDLKNAFIFVEKVDSFEENKSSIQHEVSATDFIVQTSTWCAIRYWCSFFPATKKRLHAIEVLQTFTYFNKTVDLFFIFALDNSNHSL